MSDPKLRGCADLSSVMIYSRYVSGFLDLQEAELWPKRLGGGRRVDGAILAAVAAVVVLLLFGHLVVGDAVKTSSSGLGQAQEGKWAYFYDFLGLVSSSQRQIGAFSYP